MDSTLAAWIHTVCHAERWLELRYVRGSTSELLRGFVARRSAATVVALRSGDAVTFTSVCVDDPERLGSIVTTGLGTARAADFTEFTLPARVGARADERLRSGSGLNAVIDGLGISKSAAAVVHSAYVDRRAYVEIRAGQNCDGIQSLSEVGVGVVDTDAGRVVVSPSRADDDEWLSTFAPGTPFAVALAVNRLTELLPDGGWFPDAAPLTRWNSSPSSM